MSRHVAPARWAQLGRGEVREGDRARMLAHADGCDACARGRDRVLGAVDAFAAIRATPAPELGWDHIRARVYWATSSERRSRERTAEFARVRRRRWALALVAVAAAGAAGVMIASAGSDEPRVAPPPPVVAIAPPPAPVPAALRGVVTLAVGRVALDRAASPTEVMAGAVTAGSALTTLDGRVAVQFGEGSGFAIGPRSTVTVRRFDAAAIELAIVGDGELAIEVAPRAPGQRFVVDVGDRIVEVRGTAFEIRHRDGATEVACAHGLVALIDERTGAEVVVGKAQTLTLDDRAPVAGQAARALDAAGVQALLAELGPRLPGWTDPAGIDRTSGPLAVRAPVGRAVRVDGVVVGAGEVAVRVMAGATWSRPSSPAARSARAKWVTTATGALTRVEPGPSRSRHRAARAGPACRARGRDRSPADRGLHPRAGQAGHRRDPPRARGGHRRERRPRVPERRRHRSAGLDGGVRARHRRGHPVPPGPGRDVPLPPRPVNERRAVTARAARAA